MSTALLVLQEKSGYWIGELSTDHQHEPIGFEFAPDGDAPGWCVTGRDAAAPGWAQETRSLCSNEGRAKDGLTA